MSRLKWTMIFLIATTNANESKSEWYRERWDTIAEAENQPSSTSVPKLGAIVRGMGRDKDEFTPETKELYDAARETLLSLPDHAFWFGDEIKRLTEEEIVGRESHERGWYYETLSQLPSAETVKVLGELVFDERDPWKALPPTDGGKPLSNATRAVITLNRLGIKNAPSKKNSFDEADIHTWQLWFEQVKAGTRSFSFEGDDRVYSLADTPPRGRRPASAAANPLSREPASPDGEAAKPGSRWPWLVALTALGSAIVAVLLRKLQKAGLR